MSRLEDIYKLLPDNDNGEITESSVRKAFGKTFEEITDQLSKPTTTISEPNTTYKYALLMDREGNTTQMLAGDLGKNIANASLRTTASHTFTLDFDYTFNANNKNLKFANLPSAQGDASYTTRIKRKTDGTLGVVNEMQMLRDDFAKIGSLLPNKTADVTYNGFVVHDANGNTATGGVTNIISALQGMTQLQINTMFNILGGNYKGMMSLAVNGIFPITVSKTNNETHKLTIVGDGLTMIYDDNLSYVKIINTNDNSSKTVGYNTISLNRMEIFVPDDFLEIGVKYKIEILSGVQRLVSKSYFECVDSMSFQNINIDDSDWENVIYNQETYDSGRKIELRNNVFSISELGTSVSYSNGTTINPYQSMVKDLSGIISNTDNFTMHVTMEVPKTGIDAFHALNSVLLFNLKNKDKSLANTNAYAQNNYEDLVIIGSSVTSERGMRVQMPYNRSFKTSSVINYNSIINVYITRLNGVYSIFTDTGYYYTKETNIIKDLAIEIALYVSAKRDSFIKINEIVKWS